MLRYEMTTWMPGDGDAILKKLDPAIQQARPLPELDLQMLAPSDPQATQRRFVSLLLWFFPNARL